MGRRVRVAIQSTLLLLGSLIFALVLCEGIARVYAYLTPEQTVTDVGPTAADTALPKKYFNFTPLAAARRLERPLADRYIPRIQIANGMNRKWFDELPAGPDRDPKDVNPEAAALEAEYIERGHYGPQASYIWNDQFVKDTACDDHDRIFTNLPRPVKVFHSADATPFPRYRFSASRTLPSGLKTNRYGFRGPDFPPEHASNVIRIAFIGSSETIGEHSFPFSYPEYFGIWLNKWLAANGHPFHVEIINAGREGIGTTDVVAILKEEVLPLAPDYVIFYDGANQEQNAGAFAEPSSAVQRDLLPEFLKGENLVPASWAAHSHLAKLANDAFDVYVEPALDDWRRPHYDFKFPAGVDEAKPDPSSSNLPLGLPVFLRDLRTMANVTRAGSVPFMISTLTWLDGSELTPGNPYQTAIRAQLKTVFWPLRPPEIHRLINFTNRTLRQFSKSNDVGLLEIAREYPHDPDLFTDGYHMTPEGLKLLAWISLQHFLPRLAEDLHDGKLGKSPAVSVHLPMPDGVEFVPTCRPTPEAMAVARMDPLASMAVGSQWASLQPSASGVAFRSPPQPWAYIGRMPLGIGCIPGGGWIAVDIRVTRGTAGVGVLNQKGDDFLVQHLVAIGDTNQTVFLWLESFAAAGDLIVRNWAEEGSSEGIVRAVRIVTRNGKTTLACPVRTAAAPTNSTPDLSAATTAPVLNAPPEAVKLRDTFGPPLIPGSNSRIDEKFPIQVSTPAQPWAYGAQFPLRAHKLTGTIWIRIRASAIGGTVGIGVLNRDGSDFLARTSLVPSGDTTVTLPMTKPEQMGDLVIQSWDKGTPSKVRIDAITVLAPRSTVESLTEKVPAASSSDELAGVEEISDAFGPPLAAGSNAKLGEALPAEVTTPPRPWAYGAQFPLRKRNLSGPVLIKVRADVHSGPIGIGILNRDGNDFLSRTSVVTTGDTTVTLRVDKPEQLGDLVIQSWAAGEPGDVQVNSITVLTPRSSAPLQQ